MSSFESINARTRCSEFSNCCFNTKNSELCTPAALPPMMFIASCSAADLGGRWCESCCLPSNWEPDAPLELLFAGEDCKDELKAALRPPLEGRARGKVLFVLDLDIISSEGVSGML